MQSRRQGNIGAIILVAFVIIVLGAVFYIFPPWEVATDAPDKAQHAGMAQLPVALWWAGAGILAIALTYGVVVTRHRSRAEKLGTEEGTRRLYEDESRKERSR
jgi:hypothetical protein